MISLLLLPGTNYAQTGDSFLSHHSMDIDGLDNTNFEIAVDRNGMLCLANRSGVLLYDGDQWDFLETPSAALSIALDSAQNIYVGCVGDYGRIGFENNRYQYISMSDEEDKDRLFFSTFSLGSQVFFMSEKKLVFYDAVTGKVQRLNSDDETHSFASAFEYDGKPTFQSSQGFFRWESGALVRLGIQPPDQSEVLVFAKRPSSNTYLVGTSSNGLYELENGRFTPAAQGGYLQENGMVLTGAAWITKELLAISTLESGCLIFDTSTGELKEIIDYHKGLSDNEIYAIATDNEEGLWLAHEFGLSRLESGIPVKTFSNYPGIDGNLTGIIEFNERFYVSSSHGVFYLEKEHEYRNSVYYTLRGGNVRTPRKTVQKLGSQVPVSGGGGLKLPGSSTRSQVNSSAAATGNTQTGGSTQSVLSFGDGGQSAKNQKMSLLNRNALKFNSGSSATSGQLKSIKGRPKPTQRYIRHVKREIIDTRYLYKRVEGLSAKTRHFISFRDKLLVSGSSGVYELNNQSATLVIPKPVRHAYSDAKNDRLIIITHANEIFAYELVNNLWVETSEIDLGDMILSVLADDQNRLWFAGSNKLYMVRSLENDEDSISSFEISNHFIDNVKLVSIQGKIYVINTLGFFYYDESSGRVHADSSLFKKTGQPLRHLQQEDGSVWIFNGREWHHINKNLEINTYEHLGLFPKMTFADEFNGKLWLINDNKEILQYNTDISASLASNNKMFFRDIRNRRGQVNRRGDLRFSYDNNSFEFKLSRPDYLGLLKVEYQYKLEGLNNRWSNWSANNKLDFNYLPPDKYVLHVKSRGSFGHIQEGYPFEFVIQPPYWHTLWFYALQIVCMVGLVFISIQLNRRAKTKYVLLTEGLSILTIVLIIEFLQTVAQAYLGLQSTPVVDFLIDVGIALMVLPLEFFLKKVMRVEEIGPGLSGKGILDLVPGVGKGKIGKSGN